MSGFIKVIEFNSITKHALEELRANIEQWDSQHSILFTGRTADVFHEFRMLVAILAQMSDEELRVKFVSDGEKTAFRNTFAEVELALKSDLGIYIVEFPETKKPFRTYKEIEDVLKRTEKS